MHANLNRGKLGNCRHWICPLDSWSPTASFEGGEFLHKHVFYRCPHLRGGPPLRDSDQDGEEESLLNMGIDIRGTRRQEESESDREPKSDSDREQDVDEVELDNRGLDSYERHSDSDAH